MDGPEKRLGTVPEPPPGTPVMEFGDDVPAVCGFVAAQAARHGVIGNRAALLVIAAGDVATHLTKADVGRATVRVWARARELVCRIQSATEWREPPPVPRLGGQIEVSSAGSVTIIRLPREG